MSSYLSKNDRIWCIIDAQTLTVITAREVPKVLAIHAQWGNATDNNTLDDSHKTIYRPRRDLED